MDRDPDERAQPDGAPPDEFEAIVAGWRREGPVPEWPADGPAGRSADPLPDLGAPAAPAAPAPDAGEDGDEDEHFVPPEPPPLPRLGPPALVGLTLIMLGLVLVVSPGWLGVSEPYGLPLGLVGLAAGLGWLVLRLWPDPPEGGGGDHDDGAIV